MSRREARESDSKRHRSKFDREPSPKRSRRDGKPATERPSSNLNLDVGDHSDRDQKHRRRLQDALPLEAPPALDSKVETGAGNKEIDKKTNGQHEGTKNSSNPTEASRSRSYFQCMQNFFSGLMLRDTCSARVPSSASLYITILGLPVHVLYSTVSVVMPGKLVEPLVAEQLLSVDGGTQRIIIVTGQRRRQLLVIQRKKMRNPKLGAVPIVFGAMTMK